MNVLKNFEALFVVALGLACAANYVIESAPAQASKPVAVQAAAPAYAGAKDMQVIVVSAKRMTPEQKLQSLLEERKAAHATARG